MVINLKDVPEWVLEWMTEWHNELVEQENQRREAEKSA